LPAYVVVSVEVSDPERFARYAELAEETIARAGARYLVRGGRAQLLEGDATPGRVVVLEFESADAARAWYESEGYLEARAAREGAAKMQMTLVEGYTEQGR
jgi:uncharacterized protein (DUF1330 family)